MTIFSDTQGLEEDDPILSLAVHFRKETRPHKVNLGIGAYATTEGKPFVLNSVQRAEKHLLDQKLDKEYLPIEGDRAFLQNTLALILGNRRSLLDSGRFAMVQTIGATSALRIGGDYLALQGSREVYLSDPTWSNHRTIFGRADLTVKSYPYFDKSSKTLDFTSMCKAIRQMPKGSAILLHACCHNPTGIEPTAAQWKELSLLIKAQGVLPFFDLAYQGFGNGLDEDALPIRHFAQDGHDLFVAYSYSKNMGLYGERVGALFALCESEVVASKVQKQLKSLVRGVYSTPPLQGARIVDTVLGVEENNDEWKKELLGMRQRIQDMRKQLIAGLALKIQYDLSYMRSQQGLFSYGLLMPEHVIQLREAHAIYLPPNGRINVAGLNAQNLHYVVNAIHAVVGG